MARLGPMFPVSLLYLAAQLNINTDQYECVALNVDLSQALNICSDAPKVFGKEYQRYKWRKLVWSCAYGCKKFAESLRVWNSHQVTLGVLDYVMLKQINIYLCLFI